MNQQTPLLLQRICKGERLDQDRGSGAALVADRHGIGPKGQGLLLQRIRSRMTNPPL
jgi:hypothetical protein